MALIFFEGFGSPSGADPAYWSFKNSSLGFTPAGSYSEKERPRIYAGGYNPNYYEPTAMATLRLPTAHSNKVVYIGCSVRDTQPPSYYYNGISTEPAYLSPLFTIKNHVGTHVIDIAFAPRPDWAADAPNINLGVVLTVTQTVNTVVTTNNFRVPAELMRLIAVASGIVITGSQRSDYSHYFEFKLDFVNAQFAVRYNDQLLGLHSDTSIEYATLAATSMQKLVLPNQKRILANGVYPQHYRSFQDLYIADSTGSGVVSWLGADTHVVEPVQSSSDTAEWLTLGTSSGGAVVNSADGDTTSVYTRTLSANQTYTQNNSPEYKLWPDAITNIAAVKISSVARCTSVSAAIKHVYENSSNVITPMSAALPLTTAYKMRATHLEQNPATSAAWTKEDISAGSFGVQSTANLLAVALTPAFGTPTGTVDGFTVQINNYDAAYTWAGTASESGTVVVSGSGLVTVTGVPPATNSTATITTTRTGYVEGTADIATVSGGVVMVTVGNPGNAADTRAGTESFGGATYGAVAYSYKIGQYDVTVAQYTAFLNAVGATDTYGLYDAQMALDTDYTSSISLISQSGSSESYTYAVAGSMGNRPIVFVSWFECARFANWLSNGQPSGAQNSTTTEDGAYTLNGATSGNNVAQNATNPNTSLAPTHRIPTENEWYKAAYYSPNYDSDGGYYVYATQNDYYPGNTIGAEYVNQANHNRGANYGSKTVGAFGGSPSFYGTFDQSGNVSQWNDLDGTAGGSDAGGIYRAYLRGLRGGDWTSNASGISYANNGRGNTSKVRNVGFRLAGPV